MSKGEVKAEGSYKDLLLTNKYFQEMVKTKMKAVILSGGLGTRISEETHLKPKPMIEVGGRILLWHIMKLYSYYNINDFIICCGYKGEIIKEYFSNYFYTLLTQLLICLITKLTYTTVIVSLGK